MAPQLATDENVPPQCLTQVNPCEAVKPAPVAAIDAQGTVPYHIVHEPEQPEQRGQKRPAPAEGADAGDTPESLVAKVAKRFRAPRSPRLAEWLRLRARGPAAVVGEEAGAAAPEKAAGTALGAGCTAEVAAASARGFCIGALGLCPSRRVATEPFAGAGATPAAEARGEFCAERTGEAHRP